MTTEAPAGGRPAPPKLPRPAKALWREIVDGLQPGFFSAGDLPLLRAYVLAAHLKNMADALVLKEGLLTSDGKPHPAMAVSNNLGRQLGSLAGKLRLCPSSRTRPDAASLKHALRKGRRSWADQDDASEFFPKGLPQ